MPEPINYMGMYPQANPLGNLVQGLQAGAIIGDIRQKQIEADQAQELKKQYAIDLTDAFNRKDPSAFAKLSAKYPGQREAFKQSWEMLSEGEKQHTFSQGSQVYTALQNGNLPLAKEILDTNIKATENTGKDASGLKNIRDLIDTNPEKVLGTTGLYLSSVDPDQWKKVQEAYVASQTAPEKVTQEIIATQKSGFETAIKQTEAEQAPEQQSAKTRQEIATAKTKEAEAKYIEPKTLQDIEYKGIQTKSLLADIGYKKQMAQIAAMNAATAREGNSLKREELKLKVQEKIQSLNEKAQQKASEVSGALDTNNNILNSIDRILSVPKNVREAAHGPISSKIPTLSSATADYEALMDTLGSQSFLNQVQSLKGMGALSDAEGKKLQAGMQNLSLAQSAKQAEQNIREMQKLVLKARKNIELKYGIKAPPPSSEYKSEADSAAIFAKYGIK